jgi:hypothetical protein
MAEARQADTPRLVKIPAERSMHAANAELAKGRQIRLVIDGATGIEGIQ